MAPQRKRPEGNSGRCTKQQSKKVHAKKRKYYFQKKKVATVVADESESPSVVPGVEEEVAIDGESSSVLAPSIFPDETSTIVADVASSLPADVDVDFLMEDVICDEKAGSSSSVIDETASSSKIEEIVCDEVQDKHISGYRLFDMDILKNLICSLACPECSMTMLDFVEQFNMKKGLASYVSIVCKHCNYSRNSYTSKTFFPSFEKSKSTKGMKSFEVNMRMVYAMRNNGTDYSGIETFCAVMNLPKPMRRTNYDKTSNALRNAVKIIAEQTMQEGAESLKQENGDSPVNTAVSVDGSWQKTGFTSMNGVVTVISVNNGKILDSEPMSRRCKACAVKINENKNDLLAFNLS